MTDQPRERPGGPDTRAAPGSGRADWRLVAGLAVADLRYDWTLSFCMMLALAAVFAPLLILLGLQAGYIGHQVERLQRDPGVRLVTPRVILRDPIDPALAAGLAARAAVVIPAPEAYLTLDIAGLAGAATALPSTTDDPLLVEHALTPGPGARWAVLSERLARESGVGPGGTLVVRGVAGAAAGINLPLPVLGVLPEAAVGWVTRLWVPLPLFRQLSDGSRGQAVPELGLAATAPPVTPAFEGILTLEPAAGAATPDPDELASRCGFSQPPTAVADPGWEIPAGTRVWRWTPVGSPIRHPDLKRLRDCLGAAGHRVETVPDLDGAEVRLESAGQTQSLRLIVLPDGPRPGAPGTAAPLWVPWAADPTPAQTAVLAFDTPGGSTLRLPVEPTHGAGLHPGFVALPWDLAGQINSARRAPTMLDPTDGVLRPAPEGDRFFRAYVRIIDDLPSFTDWLRGEGQERADPALRDPDSRVQEVHLLGELSRRTLTLFALILAIAGAAALLAVGADVYAGVQRKRRDLAYLRLVGFGSGALLAQVVLKTLALVAGGLVLGLVGYGLFGLGARALPDLGGVLTQLPPGLVLALAGGILGAATASALVAGTAVTRIDPAEHLRE